MSRKILQKSYRERKSINSIAENMGRDFPLHFSKYKRKKLSNSINLCNSTLSIIHQQISGLTS
ncbi:CLUMA_CG010555, isoform A [Clunio marinus]|uniref:CLUMA_CG010555, isoform A n=1 Tax=Clunio marinus TaxID=568069 RepID=A0A1J1IA47_9DIPT|nr:CLUMA_CG010555, isoform A [Clunio marinus]